MGWSISKAFWKIQYKFMRYLWNCSHPTSSPHMRMAKHARPSHQGKNLEGQCSHPRQDAGSLLCLLFQCSHFNIGHWWVTAVGLAMRLYGITYHILSFLKIISKIKPLAGPINPNISFYKFHSLCCSTQEKFWYVSLWGNHR